MPLSSNLAITSVRLVAFGPPRGELCRGLSLKSSERGRGPMTFSLETVQATR